MFNALRVERWSVFYGLINAGTSARCFFMHEYVVGAWLGLLALAAVVQFYVAGTMVKKGPNG